MISGVEAVIFAALCIACVFIIVGALDRIFP